MDSAKPPPRVSADRLRTFISQVFEKNGVPADDASILAELIAEADLRGTDTHGVFRLPLYVRRIRAGGINVQPNIRVVAENASTALVDGDNAMGHLAMRFAARVAVDKAKQTGVGWVGARMSNHAGPAALYVMMPLAHDMIGLYFAVGSNNHLPPTGSAEALLGTNPIAVAIPADQEPPVVMDMAPTVASFGKVRLKAAQGEPMPVGWMVDRAGSALTDAKRAGEGFLLPIGDYKGYALSLIIGLLAGTLNQAAFGRDIVDFIKHPDAATNTGQSILAVRVDAFCPVDAFKQNVDRAVRTIRESQRLPGVDRVWLPGEQSHNKRIERLRRGIPIPPALQKSLDELASELAVDPIL
ncbi:MAG TPA: Ldh family oxidoreductase [Xanthobacteraceae bacterium]|nr:Ldh family oxidoreductase [Xanthobacteraceae bacterium]